MSVPGKPIEHGRFDLDTVAICFDNLEGGRKGHERRHTDIDQPVPTGYRLRRVVDMQMTAEMNANSSIRNGLRRCRGRGPFTAPVGPMSENSSAVVPFSMSMVG